MSSPQSILNRPLNVYQLPPELLSTLSVRSIQDAPSTSTFTSVDHTRPVLNSDNTSGPTPSRTHAPPSGLIKCQTCPGAGFDTVEDQRAHFKSDWHRYNAKAKLTGHTVTAEEWEGMVDGISSISGSASSSSGSSHSQPQNKVTRLLARQHIGDHKTGTVSSDEEAELADRRRRAQLRTAIVWFSPNSSLDHLGIVKDTQLGVHRALFPEFDNAADYLQALRQLQLVIPEPVDEERRITMLMVAGGHFAGMVVGLRPKGKNDKQDVKGAGDVRILQHKTFHRYTTRRKQGGSQGLNDNAKSKAVSAGAMLRRYGEQALQEEIRELLTEWADDIALSEKIFIRASTHGKKSFWGYEGAVLEKTDERIRTFPFPTRRPTQQELLRCWHELNRAKISHLTEEALAALDEAYITSLQPKRQAQAPPTIPTPRPTIPEPPKLSPEEEATQARLKRIDEMIRKGRLEALRLMWDKHTTDFEPSHLGVAAMSGQEEIVRFFLVAARLDPAVSLDVVGRRAYDMSSTKGVRNVFRRVAYDHPDWFDWVAARVPSGLSEEAEAAQGQKKAERRKGLREKMKERAAAKGAETPDEEDEEEEVQPIVNPPPTGSGKSGPQKLGGAGNAAGLAGMSAEMRMQVERERRARAAEARFKTTPAS